MPGSTPRHIQREWNARCRRRVAGQVLSCEALRGCPESAAQYEALNPAICATKEALRLAQSLSSQVIEHIGIFVAFSSPQRADSMGPKKRDSSPDSAPPKADSEGPLSPPNCRAFETC